MGAGCVVLFGMSRASVLLLFVALCFRSPVPLWAQAPVRPDSSELSKQARNAQASFERLRRRRMRVTRRYVGASCDERIGRICLTHGGDDDWTPVPDPPELLMARHVLLERLADVAQGIPGDGWVLGQRVYYLAEGNRWGEAAELASRCAWDGDWWCRALLGFSYHGMGKYGAALEAFESALVSMPAEQADRWRDPSLVLDSSAEDYVDHQPDSLRATAWSQVWLLADPLYVVAGNDRLTEHYSRWVMSAIKKEARNPWAMSWGRDLEELTIRYGWERSWERIPPNAGSFQGGGGTVGHQSKDALEVVPPGFVLKEPAAVEPGQWIPEKDKPRSSHAPVYAPDLLEGRGQLAVFSRGETFVLVGATALPDEPSDERDDLSIELEPPPGPDDMIPWAVPERSEAPPQIGLFLIADDGMAAEARVMGRSQGSMSLQAPAGDYLLSLEAWSAEFGRAGRIRHGLSVDTIPPDLATLSDLVLLEPREHLPEDLAHAVPLVRPTTELTAGERVAVGWELFGLGWEAEQVGYELSLYREGRGFFRRIGRLVGLGGGAQPLRIRWSEPGPYEPGPHFRALNVDLPDVEEGDYVLRLELSLRGREPVSVTRAVRVTRPSR